MPCQKATPPHKGESNRYLVSTLPTAAAPPAAHDGREGGFSFFFFFWSLVRKSGLGLSQTATNTHTHTQCIQSHTHTHTHPVLVFPLCLVFSSPHALTPSTPPLPDDLCPSGIHHEWRRGSPGWPPPPQMDRSVLGQKKKQTRAETAATAARSNSGACRILGGGGGRAATPSRETAATRTSAFVCRFSSFATY